MSHKWSHVNAERLPTVRLAKIALRLQRLMLADRIQSVRRMIRIQLPSLRRKPGGARRADAVERQLDGILRAMKESFHG
jgi:hypothetical protein